MYYERTNKVDFSLSLSKNSIKIQSSRPQGRVLAIDHETSNL